MSSTPSFLPSMSYSDMGRIVLIFQKETRKDDILMVIPDDQSNGYYVTFKQNTIQNMTERYFANSELVPYLDRFLRAAASDSDPYDCVQVDCPTFPTVLVSIPNVLTYFPVLVDQIQSIQTYWPTEHSGRRIKDAVNHSMKFDGDSRIIVILQREDGQDDILTVMPDDETDGYNVYFEQKHLHSVTTRYVPSQELVPYLERFVRALAIDEEPFEKIQFDCPMYPTTIVRHADLFTYYHLFLDQVKSLKENWPIEASAIRDSNQSRDYDWDVLAY